MLRNQSLASSMVAVVSTPKLRRSVAETARSARRWFEGRTTVRPRKIFDARGQLGDTGTGAVYAYFDQRGSALYVGLTGRRVKARLHDQTSPHKTKPWWRKWKTMRFIQMPEIADRQILEFLLIVAYAPPFNTKPSGKAFTDLLPV